MCSLIDILLHRNRPQPVLTSTLSSFLTNLLTFLPTYLVTNLFLIVIALISRQIISSSSSGLLTVPLASARIQMFGGNCYMQQFKKHHSSARHYNLISYDIDMKCKKRRDDEL